MKPNGGGAPTGALAEAITRDFGSLDKFKEEFKQAGLTQFGSGWAWLVTDKSGKLSVTKSPNAVTPVVEGKTPILTVDVWEVRLTMQNLQSSPTPLTLLDPSCSMPTTSTSATGDLTSSRPSWTS